jgi:DNA-binding NarL/FixJ family response regulator
MPNAPRNGNRDKVDMLTSQGWSATRIGRALNIAPNTVYSHRHAIRKRKTVDYSYVDRIALGNEQEANTRHVLVSRSSDNS